MTETEIEDAAKILHEYTLPAGHPALPDEYKATGACHRYAQASDGSVLRDEWTPTK